MNKKQNLKAEYIKLKNQTAPELWDQIEEKLELTAPIKKELVRKVGTGRILARSLATACLFVCITVVYLFGTKKRWESSSLSETSVEFSKVMETQAESEEKQIEAGMDKTKTGTISYQMLSFEDSKPMVLPETVKAIENDRYFSEAILADTELLCEGLVKDVSFEYDLEGAAIALSYQIEVKQVLFSQDYVSKDQVLTVKSEIDKNAILDENILYALSENRTYLLPLAAKDQSMWLVFPFVPQIEVTRNQEYLFHNGWQSLVNEDSYIVLNEQAAPEDFYFDRMYLRKDYGLVEELVSLTEAMNQ